MWEEHKERLDLDGVCKWLSMDVEGAKGGVWIDCGEYWLGKDMGGA